MLNSTDANTAIQSALHFAKAHGAEQATMSLSASTGFTLSVREGDVESLEHQQDTLFGVTAYVGQQRGHASTTDVSEAEIHKAIEAAITLAKVTAPDPHSGLPEKENLAFDYTDLDLDHPWAIQPEQAIQDLQRCEKAALAVDSRLKTESMALHTASGYRVLANTQNFCGTVHSSDHSVSCSLIAEDKQGMQRDGEYSLARNAADLWTMEALAKASADRCLSRLDARSLATEKVPVLFNPQTARSLWRHFIGAISGRALYRQSSFLLDTLDKKLFPDFIQMIEQPYLQGAIGSAPFDDEGCRADPRAIVDSGVLQRYILSTYAGRRLNLPSTGNAGGVRNLTIQSRMDKLDDVVQSIDRGLLVTELMGQGVDLTNGNYSRGAAGFWIEHGKIQFPVHEMTIAGNLKAMFQDIRAVCDDVDYRGNCRTGSVLIDGLTMAGQA
ncbi:MAG: PmbA protein [marine bacterium B5-7]|nr:MAG: PmbA protein [marine bacterium B5-7]